VSPPIGLLAGGFEVAVIGANLGAGDITGVTLAGVAATAVTWVNATYVRVVAGAAGGAASGACQLVSASFGTGSGAAFTYTPRAPRAPCRATVPLTRGVQRRSCWRCCRRAAGGWAATR
jgi:hypothetical protein